MINQLVIHKKLKTLGIGCISKELKNHVYVNFGLTDCDKFKKTDLEIIDTSNCKTISFIKYKNRRLKDNSAFDFCILGNELKHFVGIGWITHRVITIDDLKTYPRVI